MSNEISKSLGLPPLEGEIIDTSPTMHTKKKTEENKDYDYARENFYNVIEKGTQALEDMLDVAKASEHPRAYEVVSTLMKTLVDANKDLVKMAEDKRKSENEEPGANAKNVTNNNIITTTADLQQMLKDMRNDK